MTSKRLRRIRWNTWAVPSIYAATAIVAGIVFPRLERAWWPDLVSTMSPSAAMAVCSAIASGMIALTGIVFSLAFVMVQFSATAYSPRLVMWVARDPVLSHAMGVFTATFLYALAFLAWVDRGASGAVPLISGWLVLTLLVASMGLFIALIARISELQVGRMLIFLGRQGRQAIEDFYSATMSQAVALPAGEARAAGGIQTLLYRGEPQVIEAIDPAALVSAAAAAGAVVEVIAAVGDTVVELTPLLCVRGASGPVDEAALRRAIHLGDERTFEQDPKYALRLIVDIAIKALSPAINDPTTAVQALNHVEDLLIRLGQLDLNRCAFRDQAGVVRLIVQLPDWEDILQLAFDEIRTYGAGSVQVMRRMRALIHNLSAVLPPERRPSLRHWERRLEGLIARSFIDAGDQRDASVADRQGLGIGQDFDAGT